MNLAELAKAFNDQLQAGPAVTIDDAVLGSTGVDDLMAAQLGQRRLEAVVPGGKVSYPGTGPLAFSGTVTFLDLPPGQEVTLTFLEVGGRIVFDLTATLPGSWDFGTSFPDLGGGPLEGLLVAGPGGPRAQLVFSTFVEAGVPGAPNPFAVVGLNFNGTIGLSRAFAVLLHLLELQAKEAGRDFTSLDEAPLRGPIERVPVTAPDGAGGSEIVIGTLMRLQAELLPADQPSSGLPIGPVSIASLYVAIANAYVEDPVPGTIGTSSLLSAPEEPADQTPIDGYRCARHGSLAFGGITRAFTKEVAMEVDVTAVSRGRRIPESSLELLFFSPQPSQAIVSLEDLDRLLGTGWEGEVPEKFRDTFSFGLKTAAVSFGVSAASLELRMLRGSMGLTRPWQLYETAAGTTFVLDPLEMSFSWLAGGSRGANVEGRLTVTGADEDPLAFAAAVDFGANGLWEVGGRYLGTVGFSLDDLNAAFFSDAPVPDPKGGFFAGVQFANPGFAVDYDSAGMSDGIGGELKRLVLETGLEAELDLLGAKVLKLEGCELVVTYVPGAAAVQPSTSALLTGTVAIVGIGFWVSAEVSSGGLHLQGELLVRTPIDLLKFAGQLIPGSLPPPGGDRLQIEELSVAVDTEAGTYLVAGKLSGVWSIPIGDGATFLAARVSARVESSPPQEPPALSRPGRRHREAANGLGGELVQGAWTELDGSPGEPGAAGEREYAVELKGQLVIAGMTFAIEYEYAAGRSVLGGNWKAGGGEKFDYAALAAALGIPAGGLDLPQGMPDLGMAELALRLTRGGGTDLFELSGTSSKGDAGCFVARRSDAWGFAVGVRIVKSGWLVQEIPGLAELLEDFDFEQATVLLASFTDPSFQLPALMPGGAGGVTRGFNFYASFDLSGNTQPEVEAARTLLALSDPKVLVTAHVSQAQGGGLSASFQLATRARREFGSIVFHEADIGFSVEQNALAVWIELALSARVHEEELLFGGRIEVGSEGFDAILWLDASRFRNHVWSNAFGVEGLTIGSAALLLGISSVDEIPSFGVYGSLGYRGFAGTVVALLDSQTVDPTANQSMFVASVSDFSLGALVALLAGQGNVSKGIVAALDGFAVTGTKLFTTTISVAEAKTLNEDLQVPDGLMAAFAKAGFGLPSSGSRQTAAERRRRARRAADEPEPASPFEGVSVAPEKIDDRGRGTAANLSWTITDRVRLWNYTVTAAGSGPLGVEVELNAQLYLVPNQITRPRFPALRPGYHANGMLKLFGAKVWLWATVRVGLGGAPQRPELEVPGIQLAAFFDEVEFGDLVAITRGSSREEDGWWRERMEAAEEHLLPNQSLGRGPAISVSTMRDDHAPEGLRDPHVFLAGGVRLIKDEQGEWLAEADVLIAVLPGGGFVFRFRFKLDTVQFLLKAEFDQKASQFNGRAQALGSASLGEVDLPVLGKVLPGGREEIDVELALAVAVGTESKLLLEVEFKAFSIDFPFSVEVDASFLRDLLDELKEFMEKNGPTIFAAIFGKSGFAKWLAAALAGAFKGQSADFFTRAMDAFGQAASAAAALLQALNFSVALSRAAIIAVYEGKPGELGELVDRVFGLQINSLVLAQRVGPQPGQPVPTEYGELDDWVGKTMLPAIEGSEWASVYSAQGQWLGVIDLRFLAVIEIGVAFYDPGLASLRLALEVPGTKVKLGIEIGYRRVSDGLGVYSGQIKPPSVWGRQSFGPAKFAPPAISVSVYTNGDFLFDAGFPFDDDWSETLQVTVGPLVGSGGFYFGALPAAADQLLPAGSGCNPVVEAGVALKLGYGTGLDIGILSGGISVDFAGILQGAVGFRKSDPGNFLATPAAVALAGQLSISGSIYGELDVGIGQASASFAVKLTLAVAIVTGRPLDLSFEAEASGSVEIKGSIFGESFTIGSIEFSRSVWIPLTLPWSAEAELPAPAEPVAFLAAGELGDALGAAGPWAGRPSTAGRPPLPIYFAPEATVVYPPSGPAALAMAGLVIEYRKDGPSPFAELAAAAAHWTLATADEGYRAGGRIGSAGLRRVARGLRASRRSGRRYGGSDDGGSTAADYRKLTEYLSAAFAVTVTEPPPDRQITGVPFPMPPDLTLSARGGEDEEWRRDFAGYNRRDGSWQEWVEGYFNRVKVFGEPRRPAADNGGLPVCEYLFVDWFQLLQEGAVELLERDLRRRGADQLASADLELVDYGGLAGDMTRFFRNGMQLPEAAESDDTLPMFALSGQQFALLSRPGRPYELELAADPGVSWLTVAGARARLDDEALERLLSSPPPPGLATTPTVGPLYEEQPRTWAVGTVASLSARGGEEPGASYVVAALPPSLTSVLGTAAAPVPVELQQRDSSQPGAGPTPVPSPRAQALRVPLRLRRVPGSEGSYEVWGIDQSVLARLDSLATALAAGQGETEGMTGTLAWAAGGTYVAMPASRSSMVLLRTNLTTGKAPPHAGAGETPPVVAADLAEPAGLVEILRWYGRTNAPGCYLSCPEGLPASLFAGDVAEVMLMLAAAPLPPPLPPEAATISLAAWADTLALGPSENPPPASSIALSAVAAPESGLLDAAPAVSAGVIPIAWSRPAVEVSDPLGSLYSMLTFAVEESPAFEASVAAVPASPTTSEDDHGRPFWSWSLFAPVAKLAKGSPGSPYATIGSEVTFSFAVRDVFGNELPDSGQPGRALTVPYLYTDRLISVSSWPGVSLCFDFAAEREGTVLVELAADPRVLEAEGAGDAAAVELMAAAVDQLAGPAVALSLATSLDATGGSYAVGGDNAPYLPGSPSVAEFAGGVLSALRGEGPAPPPCAVALTPAVPIETGQPVAVGVTFTVEREEHVDPEVAAAVAEVGSVEVAARPVRDRDEAELAAAFAAAFDRYVLAASGEGEGGTLYAVSENLLGVTIGGPGAEPLYFSPLPVSSTLVSGSVEVPAYRRGQSPPLGPASTFTYVDRELDAELGVLFSALDDLLAPAPAAAARAATATGFKALVEARAALARTYVERQLSWLFAEQTPAGPESAEALANLRAARSVFGSQIDASLATAFQIETLIQVGVSWDDPAAGDGVPGSVELFGSVEPVEGDGAAATHFQRGSARVRLERANGAAGGRLTFASTLGVEGLPPGADPDIELPLQYRVTDLVLDDPEAEGPATWLRLIEPFTAPIGDRGSATAIPAPRRQFPVPPTLVSQDWSPRLALGEDGDPPPGFAALREWRYRYVYSYAEVLPETEHPVLPDSIRTVVAYDRPAAARTGAPGGSGMSIADALGMFGAGFALVAADLAALPVLEKAEAEAAIGYFLHLVEAVLGAEWRQGAGGSTGPAAASEDVFEVDFVDAAPSACEGSGRVVLRLRAMGEDATAAIGRATITPYGPDGPIPESRLHRCHEPGSSEKFVLYDPEGASGWLTFAIELDGLDVLNRQSASATVQTRRNADLLPSLTTNEGYVYSSRPVRGAKPIVPSLARPDQGLPLAAMTGHDDGSAEEYLGWLLTDLLQPPGAGPAPPPTCPIRLGVGLEVALTGQIGEDAIAASVPIVLTPTVRVAAPSAGHRGGPAPGASGPYGIGALAHALGAAVDGFLAEGADVNSSLVIAATVFADDRESHASVLSLGRLLLPLARLRPRPPGQVDG